MLTVLDIKRPILGHQGKKIIWHFLISSGCDSIVALNENAAWPKADVLSDKDCSCCVTHHRVAGLKDLTEQDGTLTLCKRLSERTEAAGVSDIWTADTLKTHRGVVNLNSVRQIPKHKLDKFVTNWINSLKLWMRIKMTLMVTCIFSHNVSFPHLFCLIYECITIVMQLY